MIECRNSPANLCASIARFEGRAMAIDTENGIVRMIREFGRPDVHIGASEDESPYVPFIENVYIRHLAFDVRCSSFANICG